MFQCDCCPLSVGFTLLLDSSQVLSLLILKVPECYQGLADYDRNQETEINHEV